MEYHSRRAAVSTKVPVSEASAESLLDLCSTFNVCHISDLPVYCLGAVNGVGHINLGEGFTEECSTGRVRSTTLLRPLFLRIFSFTQRS